MLRPRTHCFHFTYSSDSVGDFNERAGDVSERAGGFRERAVDSWKDNMAIPPGACQIQKTL